MSMELVITTLTSCCNMTAVGVQYVATIYVYHLLKCDI